jgi:hypothetical protein
MAVVGSTDGRKNLGLKKIFPLSYGRLQHAHDLTAMRIVKSWWKKVRHLTIQFNPPRHVRLEIALCLRQRFRPSAPSGNDPKIVQKLTFVHELISLVDDSLQFIRVSWWVRESLAGACMRNRATRGVGTYGRIPLPTAGIHLARLLGLAILSLG